MFTTLLNGFVLGWSIAWPPGPVNAEMIRRGLLPKNQGGGFWAAWPIGLAHASAILHGLLRSPLAPAHFSTRPRSAMFWPSLV